MGRLQASVGRGDPVGIVSPGARLHRSSARHRARRFGNSNGKPGKLELLNMTMIINSGAMARDDSIRVNKPRIEVGRRAPTFRPDLPRPRLHRSRPPRTFNHRYLRRQLVGGRCFGTSCDD